MKKIKIGLMAVSAACATLALASCGSDADYKVGVLQFVTHDALDKATNGFKDKLNELMEKEGKKVEFVVENPEADNPTLLTLANKLVGNCDLVMGNATPAATQLAASAKTAGKTDLPILFTSVTDPVDAGLVTSNANPGGSVTGTSDMNPIQQQMEMIFDFDNSVDKIGFLYCANESNSKVQVDAAVAYLKNTKGFNDSQIQVEMFSDNNAIGTSASALVSGNCDVVYLPTDNIVAANVPAVTNVTNTAHIPTFAAEESMCNAGATLSLSINYTELGKTTGEMAFDILFNGKKPSEIAVKQQTEASKFNNVANTTALTQMGITLSDTFKAKYGL